MRHNENVLLAILSGIAAGVVIGLLVAPEKGAVTRQNIRDSATDLSNKFKSAASDTVDALKELGNSVAGDYDQYSKEG